MNNSKIEIQYCRVCTCVLTNENWYLSNQKKNSRICKKCANEDSKKYGKKYREKYHNKLLYSSTSGSVSTQIQLRYTPKDDHIWIGSVFTKSSGNTGASKTNRNCGQFLGIYISEQILSKVFKNVQRMKYGNPGYDFICGKGYKIDVKSTCGKKKYTDTWGFHINKNKIPDYFLCLAFDNRKDLNPQHVWLIPSHILNNNMGVTISKTTLNKWKQYEQPIDKVISCCDIMKESNNN